MDYGYQFACAAAAAKNGVPCYVLVSSYGADPSSKNFYYRMKGELDRDVQKLGFKSVYIMRPSFLMGDREQVRLAERAASGLAKGMTKLPGLHKFRPIDAETVAKAMLQAAHSPERGCTISTLDELFERAGEQTANN